MDAANRKANLRQICSLLAAIAVVCGSSGNTIASAEGNPGSSGDNGSERSGNTIHVNGKRSENGKIQRHPTESCSASRSQGINRPLMILSTVDGKVVALDIHNAGQQQWSMDAGIGPLLSSSISQFEIMGPEGIYKVIPSLNGGLFKWDGESLEAVPFTAETLLSTSFKLNEETMMVGGKEINTFGINARTGQLHYICGTGGCQIYGDEAEDDEDIIVVQHTRQTVRAVDQRNGMEKWNFSVGQHDVTFLKGKLEPSSDMENDDEVVCEVENDYDYDYEDDIPSVKVDMASKTVFAMGGASGRQLLWSHELESCIASAWTIQNGVVSEVDLFQPVTLGLSSGADPLMTPFFSDYSQPMLFVGNHKKQLYVQPSSNTDAAIAQAAWAAHRGQAKPQDGSLMVPRVRWRPYAYTSVSRTPTLVAAKNEENLNAANKEKGEQGKDVTVWNQYPFDNGYYLLHQLTPMYAMPQNKQLDSNESDDESLEILFYVSVWTWWREIFATSMVLAIGMQIFFHKVIWPRKKRKLEAMMKDNLKDDDSEEKLIQPAVTGAINGNESQEYKSRYLTDFEHTECLGKGGFGIVFQAKNKVDENSYAVKRITLPNREEARDKVLREARTLAILDHSGIVRYFNSWLEEPPLGWQDVQDKKFVGESVASSGILTSLDTPAFFNKNSELVRNHDQLMQQTGAKSGIEPCPDLFSRTRESPILKFDLSGDSSIDSDSRVDQKGDNSRKNGVESDILFPGSVDNLTGEFEVGSEFEESGSFSIVFQGTDVDDSQSKSSISDSGEETPQNLGALDESISNRSTDTSLNNTMEVPFKRYADDIRGLDRSESFQIVFEDSGCNDQPRYSDSDISKSSKSSATPSTSNWKEDGEGKSSSHLALTPSQTPSVLVKVPKIYLYIQMQLCRKETLKDWLSTNTLSRDRNKVLHIFHQILEAVNYIHGCGMIHRDLKPSNIFFSVDGKVKVGDFGLVTAIDTSMEGGEDSVDGAAGRLHTGKVGTQLYMCPEQVSGQNYDHKVDIFALGLIFFELFHPFSTQMERIMVMCKAKKQDFPKRFTKELPLEAKFAKWLLSHNPDSRPDSDEISDSAICRQLYEDFVPPSSHNVRNRGISNSSR